MSVRTQADECLDRAKSGINDSITDLSQIVINRVWGSDEYKPEYKKKIDDSLITLLKIRDDLG
jgi:hypothetical protein